MTKNPVKEEKNFEWLAKLVPKKPFNNQPIQTV